VRGRSAAALDAGTPDVLAGEHSKVYGDTFGKVDVFNKPIQQIAQGV
jgi:methyl-coenzyme M reductase beta subunit